MTAADREGPKSRCCSWTNGKHGQLLEMTSTTASAGADETVAEAAEATAGSVHGSGSVQRPYSRWAKKPETNAPSRSAADETKSR